MSKFGVCHLCGVNGKLSFEHVPPEAAFNDQRVLESDIHRLIGGDLIKEMEQPTGKFNQRGAGQYTLCERCNSSTGGWYSRSYIEFVRQVLPSLSRCALGHYRSGPVLNPSPRCIKANTGDVLQRVAAFICAKASGLSLVRYLLNPESRDADDQRVFISLYDLSNSKAARQSGLTGRIDASGESQVFSEISFPPFNLVMSVNGGCPDPRLFEVTRFKEYGYREQTTVRLALNNLAVNSYFPGDYRTFEELKSMAK